FLFTSLYFFVCIPSVLFCFFFFQAEDGIRDSSVTGVQTCALPICLCLCSLRRLGLLLGRLLRSLGSRLIRSLRCVRLLLCSLGRSEERRVGKECRSGWSR